MDEILTFFLLSALLPDAFCFSAAFFACDNEWRAPLVLFLCVRKRGKKKERARERAREGSGSKKKKTCGNSLFRRRRRLFLTLSFPNFTKSPSPPPRSSNLRRSRWPRPCSGPRPRCVRSRRRAAAPSRSVTSARGSRIRAKFKLGHFFGGKEEGEGQERSKSSSLLLLLLSSWPSIASLLFAPPLVLRALAWSPASHGKPRDDLLLPADGRNWRAKGGTRAREPPALSISNPRLAAPPFWFLFCSFLLPPSPPFPPSSSAFCPCFPLGDARGDPLASQCGSH